MVLDSRHASIQLEGFFFLGDPGDPCAGHRDLRDNSGSETSDYAIAVYRADAVDAWIARRRDLLRHVHSLDVLGVSVVG